MNITKWAKGDDYNLISGIRDSLFYIILISACIGLVVAIVYQLWYTTEQTLLSFSCEELEYKILNTRIGHQTLAHYNDRCL